MQVYDLIEATLPELAALASAARVPVAGLADRVFDLVSEDLNSRYGGLIQLMAEPLGESGLKRLQARFEIFAATPPAPPPEELRQTIGYSSSGPIYADVWEARRHARTADTALDAIADALGDVDGFIARQPTETRGNPAIAAEIARRLLQAGRAEEALAALECAAATRRKGGHWDGWDTMRIAALEALGSVERCRRCVAHCSPKH